jgi:hypothetical protein
MKIKELTKLDIKNNPDVHSRFLTASIKTVLPNYKIYKGDFYLDSFNYFPITKDHFSFGLFRWKANSDYNHFFTKKFYSIFKRNLNDFKVFNNVLVIGASPNNNYYRNLITYIPRILFILDKRINLAIHRNSSNKLRIFIEDFLKKRGVLINKFIYLDDGFYSFKSSQIPQFFSKKLSIKILNKVFKKNYKSKDKIYLTRKNANFRKIINESDLIEDLRSKDFKILDLESLSIDRQIDIFSSAEIVISPTGSALANIVFCNKGTKIIEIMPIYKYEYENVLKSRYLDICKLLEFEYFSIEADPIPVDIYDENIAKFIDKNILKQSNYYKNLLVKTDKFKKFINKI